MNCNLARPYADICSPPKTPYLAFSCARTPDFLFSPENLPARNAQIEIDCHAGLRCVALKWTLHRNTLIHPFAEGESEALPDQRFRIRIAPQKLPAGFYDIRVTLDTGLVSTDPIRPVTGVCVFGWRADKLAIRENRPADFKAFWGKAKTAMAKVPVDARQETPFETYDAAGIGAYNLSQASLPPDYDPTGHKTEVVESCKISFAGPDGGRVYAWLAKPPGEGPFPALLVLPGAGFNARPRPLEHARHGYLAIDMQVHGQDVDLPAYPVIPGYDGESTFEPPEAYYYYKVYQRVFQAMNYLTSRPDVAASRIAVAGGSQGGRLGIVIAALDARVKAVVSAIPHAAHYPYLAWAMQRNSLERRDGMERTGAPPPVSGPEGDCLAYFDPMNFAPDVKCPAMMNCGLTDPVSPPSHVWAAYLKLGSSNKTMVPLPGMGHDWSAEFDRRAWRWLEAVLG